MAEWVNHPRTKNILLAFSIPKTPKQVEKELTIRKLKTTAFLTKELLECLNPMARKGRLYITTPKARRLLQLSGTKKGLHSDWGVIGRIVASPRQKLTILLTVDEKKRTSEDIRLKASSINPHLSRISTKEILNTLIRESIIDTEIIERKRFYWITEYGEKIKKRIPVINQIP